MRMTAAINSSSGDTRRSLPQLVLAFAIVYLIWGSTYLAIALAIKTIPALLMAGVRFTLAGGMMYAWLRWRGAPRPTLRHWRSAFIVGACLFLIANGLICTAEKTVPSGLTALLVATVPLWMALLDWLVYRGPRPSVRTAIGLAIGLAGVLVLVNPKSVIGQPIHVPGAIAILISCLSWAVGSQYSRRAPLPGSVFMATGMQLFAGGILLLMVGSIRGEWSSLDPRAVSFSSIAAMLYLTTFGSIVAFTAYIWLLKNVSPVATSTYAFVNPVVAIVLGCTFGHEPFEARSALAAALIITAVVLITLRRPSAPVSARTDTIQPPVSKAQTADLEQEPCEVS